MTRNAFRAALASLGFRTYAEYLTSALWFGIRTKVLKRAKTRCEFCGGKAWQVHHEAYSAENLTGASLEGLYATCGRCHEARHFPAP